MTHGNQTRQKDILPLSFQSRCQYYYCWVFFCLCVVVVVVSWLVALTRPPGTCRLKEMRVVFFSPVHDLWGKTFCLLLLSMMSFACNLKIVSIKYRKFPSISRLLSIYSWICVVVIRLFCIYWSYHVIFPVLIKSVHYIDSFWNVMSNLVFWA